MLVARAFGRLAPRLSLPAGLDDTKLMRDEEVRAARRNDPLVHDRVTAGFGREALDAADRVLREAHRLSVPRLVIHGRADAIDYLSGSEALVAEAKGDVTLNVYDDVVSWLDRHLRPAVHFARRCLRAPTPRTCSSMATTWSP